MWEAAVVGGLVGIMFLWTFLSLNLPKDRQTGGEQHIGIKYLLILMVFLSIGVTLFVMKMIADLNDVNIGELLEVVYMGYMYMFIFIVSYYVIMFAIYAINMLRAKR